MVEENDILLRTVTGRVRGVAAVRQLLRPETFLYIAHLATGTEGVCR